MADSMLTQGDAVIGGSLVTGGSVTSREGWQATTLEITAFQAAINEVQTITVTADGGTFTLDFDGEETSALAHDATALQVQTALRALDAIAATDVAVTGNAGGPWTVTFGGALAGTDVPELIGDATSLTQGSGTAVIATDPQGAPGVSETQTITVAATEGDFTITYDGQTTAPLAWNVSAADMQTALLGLSSIADDGLTVSGGPGDAGGTVPYVLTWRADLGSLPELPTTTPAGLNGGTANVAQGVAGTNPVNEVQSLTVTAGGGTYTLTYSGQTTDPIAFDATAEEVEAALVALSNLESNSVAVTGGPGDETGSVPYVITFGGPQAGTNVATISSTVTALYEEGGLLVEATPTPGEGTGTAPAGWTVDCRYTQIGSTCLARLTAAAASADTGQGVWRLELPLPAARQSNSDLVPVGTGYIWNDDGADREALPLFLFTQASAGDTTTQARLLAANALPVEDENDWVSDAAPWATAPDGSGFTATLSYEVEV